MAHIQARDRLIVALDYPGVAEARALVHRLGEAASFYKIGLELAMNGGLDLARALVEQGKHVFLDMKLLDIANTVERATRAAAATGATFLTVHAHDTKTVAAAVAGKAGTRLQILAVTVLTNLDTEDLREQGISADLDEVVARRAELARRAGCDGIVASGQEARRIRTLAGPDMVIVTPGIRAPGVAAADQARAVTPEDGIAAGADYLVVGRPVTRAPDPRLAMQDFTHRVEQALS